MRKFSNILFVSFSLVFLAACTKETVIEKQAAPKDIRTSIQTVESDSCERRNCIQIQKNSFDKMFLLIASGRTSGLTPQWYDLKPQIVSFSKWGGEVALLAENYNSIYKEIRSQHLIQSFSVVAEDEASVTVDLGHGLSSFAVESSYDIESPEVPWAPDGSFDSLPVADSFIQNMNIEGSEYFEFDQIAKVIKSVTVAGPDGKPMNQDKEESIGMNIQIRPYLKSAKFLVKEADVSKRVGFFVTKVATSEQSTTYKNLIAKWDISDEKGPITVRITSSVPKEYLEAVKEGALYWNKVFQKEIFVLETEVDPNEGTKFRSITIRWVPWLDAGAAYAIQQSDPLTGEILRAQVFIPSAFTRIGSADQVNLNDGVPAVVGAIRCDWSSRRSNFDAELLNAPVARRTMLAQDSVRSTVAHEVGHAIGLRHNFAASFSGRVAGKEIQKASRTFLRDDKNQGLPVATSVMDYLSGLDNFLLSRYIKNRALDYDVMAMKWAYTEGDSHLNEKVSLYCSDEHIGVAGKQGYKIYGCEQFDNSGNVIERNFLSALKDKENFVSTLFVSILGRLFPPEKPNFKAPIKEVLKGTEPWIQYAPSSIDVTGLMLRKVIDSKGKTMPSFISLGLAKSGAYYLALEESDSEFFDKLKLDLDQAGGYSNNLSSMILDRSGILNLNWVESQLQDLMAQPYFKKGVTLGGRPYELTEEDQKQIHEFFLDVSKKNNVESLLAKIKNIIPFTNAGSSNNSKSGAWLRKDLLTQQDPEKLRDLYISVLSSVEFEMKFGNGLVKSAIVQKSAVNELESQLLSSILSTEMMQFSMDLAKAQVIEFQKEKINKSLKLIDPSFSLAAPAEWENWPQNLLRDNLVDQNTADYFQAEIGILKSLVQNPEKEDVLK